MNYPPKNRLKDSLPICEIVVVDKNEKFTTDPNGAVFAGATGEYPMNEPIPGLFSEISGKPAYKVMFDDMELALSFDELDRLFRRSLKKKEFEFLLNKYGMFHDIHEDFYWNGRPQQPIPIAKLTKERIEQQEEFYKSKVSYKFANMREMQKNRM